MLNSFEHEILNVHKYKNIKKFGIFKAQLTRMLFFPLIHVKMPTIVGILTSMSGENFMLNWVEHEKSFITSGPDVDATSWRRCLDVGKTLLQLCDPQLGTNT